MNRSIAPNYSQPENLVIQFPEEVQLANGIQLFWTKDVKDDSVKLDIEWRAGSKYQSKKLVANFTKKLMLSISFIFIIRLKITNTLLKIVSKKSS